MTQSAENVTPYKLLGGDEAVRALVDDFYHLMDTLPEAQTIRKMHKGDLSEMSDKLATFLIGWMGGPQRYNERFGRIIIPAAHKPFDIGQDERDQWLLCMQGAIDKSGLEAGMAKQVMTMFGHMADMCRTK